MLVFSLSTEANSIALGHNLYFSRTAFLGFQQKVFEFLFSSFNLPSNVSFGLLEIPPKSAQLRASQGLKPSSYAKFGSPHSVGLPFPGFPSLFSNSLPAQNSIFWVHKSRKLSFLLEL